MKSIKKILPYLLGLIFIASSITKLVSVDFFEQFLYSFNMLNLKTIIVLSRVIIGIEIILGLLFISQIYLKPLSFISITLLSVFTVFIVGLEVSHSGSDCYCFGTLIHFSNLASIIKNIVLIVLIILTPKTNNPLTFKVKKLIVLLSVCLGLGLSFGMNFPISLFDIQHEISYCKPCFNDYLNQEKLTDKKIIICFLSTKCKYCKLAAKKISVISQKSGNKDSILYVLWDESHNSNLFFTETNSQHFNSREMSVLPFIKLTEGQMPLIVFYNKGKVENVFRYNDINENTFINFLKKSTDK